jgi:hypothetical protein
MLAIGTATRVVFANLGFIVVAAVILTVGSISGSDALTWGVGAAAAVAFATLQTSIAAAHFRVRYATWKGIMLIAACFALTVLDVSIAVVLAMWGYVALGG